VIPLGIAPGDPYWPPGPLTRVAAPAPGRPRFPADLLAQPARLALLPYFRRWAALFGVPAGLLEAVGWMESGWRADAVSPTAAVGIGQIEPGTNVFIATQLLGFDGPIDPRSPDNNIRMSAAYLAWLLHRTQGDVANALGGYYQGLTTLRAKGPLRITRRYVAGVGALWARFRSG
jgi:soluble lytic murein transglycosylase-like protein